MEAFSADETRQWIRGIPVLKACGNVECCRMLLQDYVAVLRKLMNVMNVFMSQSPYYRMRVLVMMNVLVIVVAPSPVLPTTSNVKLRFTLDLGSSMLATRALLGSSSTNVVCRKLTRLKRTPSVTHALKSHTAKVTHVLNMGSFHPLWMFGEHWGYEDACEHHDQHRSNSSSISFKTFVRVQIAHPSSRMPQRYRQ